MKIRMDSVDQSSIAFECANKYLFKGTYFASRKTQIMKLSGIFIGAASAILNVARRVALIAEALLKGMLNIAGCFFTRECSFINGTIQLMWNVPKNIIILPFTCIASFYDVTCKTICMAIDPIKYSHEYWMEYDSIERDAFEQVLEEEREEQRRISNQRQMQNEQREFSANIERLKEEPSNAALHRKVAASYLDGTGTQRNIQNAIDHYATLANHHNDISAMLKLSEIYAEKMSNSSTSQMHAYEFAKMAAKAGSLEGILKCASYCEEGYAFKTRAHAIKWYEQAASKNHLSSIVKLGELYLTDSIWCPNKAAYWLDKASEKGSITASAYMEQLLVYRSFFKLDEKYRSNSEKYSFKFNGDRFKYESIDIPSLQKKLTEERNEIADYFSYQKIQKQFQEDIGPIIFEKYILESTLKIMDHGKNWGRKSQKLSLRRAPKEASLNERLKFRLLFEKLNVARGKPWG